MTLPPWAQVTPARRAHIERVAELLDDWATAMNVSAAERDRWRRAAWLHDALRDAPLGDPFAHGPAAAERAAAAGETDRGVLDAVRYHTIGSPDWDDVGRMLYLADYLEPGRPSILGREELVASVPSRRNAVLGEVARRRIEWVLHSSWPLPPQTVAFWNQIVGAAQ